jgi:two-component system response regulator HydG
MKQEATVLIIDDRENMLKMMSNLLQDDFEVMTCNSGEAGLESFRKDPTDLVVTDIRMPDVTGMEILRSVKKLSPDTEVILMTAYAEVSQAVEAMKDGAYDYVTKPFEPDDMVLTLQKALERKRLRERTAMLEQEVEERFGFSEIIGESPTMHRAFELARKAASSDTTVLLTGESGTGKELFARAIHYSGPRSKSRFVAVNCAAIPKDLIESELFGHVKGAFSGASRDKPGLFEEADGGTLLLDEVTELPHDMQAKINRALEQREVRRVGDTRDRPVDVRVIASSNRDLKQAIEQNTLREDLYFRLNVFPIHLPPLREREGDVPLLLSHFLGEFAGEEARSYHIEPEARDLLLRYSWPGNVRELRNAIERAVALCDDKRIARDLFALHDGAELSAPAVHADLSYREAMDRMTAESQREYLMAVLKKYDGNVTRAAEHAGIERESLHRLMRKCGVSSDDIKDGQ